MKQPTQPTDAPRLRLRLTLASGEWLGPGKADLLDGIAATGSIAAAGRRMGMSYKRAWGLVEVLNSMFPAPLVEASRGGAGHGGASLTGSGREVLALYRTMQVKAERELAGEIARIGQIARPVDMAKRK